MTPTRAPGEQARLTWLPEPCLERRCYSPTACRGWGFCRERNMKDRGAPTPQQIADRRALAGRAALAEEQT